MDKQKFKRFFIDVMEVVVSAVLITLILFKFVVIPVQVDGTSMYPYLYPGDYGYGLVFQKYFSFERFDVVVIDVSVPDTNSKLLVKRLIGFPGETIRYTDSRLYINDEYVEEPFLDSDVVTSDFEVVLGDDEYFCLGDNRSVSRDSRSYGAFSKEDFVARHVLVIMPFERFGVK